MNKLKDRQITGEFYFAGNLYKYFQKHLTIKELDLDKVCEALE